MENKPWRNKERLRKLYHEEGLTQYEISEKLGCSQSRISNLMNRHGIETNGRPLDKPGPWNNPDLIIELHHEKGMSLYAIAKRWGVSRKTVKSALEKYDIERRYVGGGFELNHINLRTGSQGYEVWTNGRERLRVHRLLAIANGADPYKIFNGYDVHHKNGIKWDNRPENIEVMPHGDHTRLHNPAQYKWK